MWTTPFFRPLSLYFPHLFLVNNSVDNFIFTVDNFTRFCGNVYTSKSLHKSKFNIYAQKPYIYKKDESYPQKFSTCG